MRDLSLGLIVRDDHQQVRRSSRIAESGVD
jgi:hypothetical protein